jgi:4-hydroxybenzoate polyprenyltransferase
MATTSMVSDRADAAPGPAAAAGSGALSAIGPFVQVMRPYQWVKNLLLALPLAMSHQVDAGRALHVALAFVVFCLCASSAYVLNDVRDAEHDRLHPVKRNRPLASGRVSRGAAYLLAAVLLALAFAVSVPSLPGKFSAMAAAYVVVTLSYSLWLKQRLLVDVFVLAGLYTLRVLAGGASIPIDVTPWLLAFCIFFFLSLAFAKRYAELRRVQGSSGTQVLGRAYHVEDIEVIASVGPTSGYMAVLVLALYVNSSTANQLYARPFLLWLVCPLILYWVTRVWFLARRGLLSEDPLLFSLKDRTSLLVEAVTAALVVLAAGGPPRRDVAPAGGGPAPSSTGASRP